MSDEGSEKPDGIEERAGTDSHDEFDGVEVLSATEAAGEVGLWIHRSIEQVARRAKETQEAVTMNGVHIERILNNAGDGDLIAQEAQMMCRDVAQGVSFRFREDCLARRLSALSFASLQR